MTKFSAAKVKGHGYSLIREEGRPYYNIVKDDVKRPLSGYVGHLYKDGVNNAYKIVLGRNVTVAEDFNAAKAFIKSKLVEAA